MRKTKIVCTIGPVSSDPAVFADMCRAGLNVARLNFSHGTHEEHQQKLDMIKQVREALGLPIAIMLDTKGPEYRIGTFQNGEIQLADGAEFTFTTRKDVEGDESIVSVSYAGLAGELAPGDTVLVNNGLVIFEVLSIEGTEIQCRVVAGGRLSNRKSMSFPGKVLKQVYLSEQDKSDLLFGIQNGVDYVAASFVSCRQDVADLKRFLQENGGGIDIIAKIENRSGIDNIEEICEECEGIMIGRGDLGVEVPFAELPAIQKYLITKCRLLGKRVITATEMLESMIQNPRPTRAEISDVANAVYDGTSAVMLSGESAAGKYPVKTVQTMSEICEETEKHIHYETRFRSYNFKIKNLLDAISHATCGMAIDIGAKAIVVSSLSGRTVRMVSRFRVPTDIIGMATNKAVWYKLALSWGVLPVLCETFDSTDVLFYHARKAAKAALKLQPGDNIVLTGGTVNGTSGNTNLIRVDTI